MLSGFTENQSRIIYGILGLVSAVIIAFTVYSFIGTFVFGVFFYYATRPIHERLSARLGKPRIVAAGTIVLFVLPFIALAGYTGLVALHELQTFIDTHEMTTIEQYLDPYINTRAASQHPIETLRNTTDINRLVRQLVGYLSIFATFIINAILVVTFTFYALKDGDRFRRELDASLPDSEPLNDFIEAVDSDFQKLFFGNILHAGLTAVIGAITYGVLSLFAPEGVKLPYPVLIGILTGAASLIPVVGMKIVYIPVIAVLGAKGYVAGPETYWFPAVVAAVSIVIVDTIPDFVIRPYVSGERLHMGMLMFAYIIGPIVFGWYGLFFGPMLLVIVTNFYGEILTSVMPSHDRCDLSDGDENEEVLVAAHTPPRVAELVGEGAESADSVEVEYRREREGDGSADFVGETEQVDVDDISEM